MKANKQSIESLAPRVKALAELLCTPAPEGDTREKSRRNNLERYARVFWYYEPTLIIISKLKTTAGELEPLASQGKIEGFFNNVKNADKLGGLVDDIRDAIIEYQVGSLDSRPYLG